MRKITILFKINTIYFSQCKKYVGCPKNSGHTLVSQTKAALIRVQKARSNVTIYWP